MTGCRPGGRPGPPAGDRDRRGRRPGRAARGQGGDHDAFRSSSRRRPTRSRHGLVASLNRPGGNLTGVYLLTTALSRSGSSCCARCVPKAAAIALLVNPSLSGCRRRRCARSRRRRSPWGRRSTVLKASNPSEHRRGLCDACRTARRRAARRTGPVLHGRRATAGRADDAARGAGDLSSGASSSWPAG